MKPNIFLISFAALAATLACGPGGTGTDVELGLPDTLVLAVGDGAIVPGGLTLTVTAVPEDSRCATDVVCVWAGNAKVMLTVVVDGVQHGLDLNTNPGDPTGPGSVVVDGFRITLLAVAPEPVSDHPIPPEDYRVTLEVSAE